MRAADEVGDCAGGDEKRLTTKITKDMKSIKKRKWMIRMAPAALDQSLQDDWMVG